MGVIKEFPGLQIDDFRGRPQLALLTHAHSDHLTGLDRPSYRGPAVWCTATTRSLVLNLRSNNSFEGNLKYNHLRKEVAGVEVLKVLPLDVPVRLTLAALGGAEGAALGGAKPEDIEVTAIDAHHCPGSCIFLVKSAHTAILYTGDIRCEQWWPGMLRTHPALIPYTCGKQQLSIYMDNIYEKHREHALDYDPGASGIAELLELLARGYPSESRFCALFTTTGYEQVLLALAAALKTKIHMDRYYYSLYLSASDTCPVSRAVVECSTTDSSSNCKVHWCAKGTCEPRDRLDAVYFSPCITISRAAVNERNAVLDTTGMSVHGQSTLPVYVNAVTGARYVRGSQMLPGHLLFYFSRHASRPALAKLVDLFSVRVVRSLDGNQMEGFSSFKSSTDEPTDESLTSLPLIRKQPVKVGNKRKSYSSESSHDEALRFLQAKTPVTTRLQKQEASTLENEPKKEAPSTTQPAANPPKQESTLESNPNIKREDSGKAPQQEPTAPQKPTMPQHEPTAPERRPAEAPSPETLETQESFELLDVNTVKPKAAQEAALVQHAPALPAPMVPTQPPDTTHSLPAQRQHTYGLSKFQHIYEEEEATEPCQDPEEERQALERELRQNRSAWFSLQFDWQSQ